MSRFTVALFTGMFLGNMNVEAGAVWSAVDDFSTTTNTVASTWSYRAANDVVRDGDYQLIPTFGESFSAWDPSTSFWHHPSTYPTVGVNNSGNPINWIGTASPFVWPDGTIWMHPSNTPGLAVVSWLSPSDMTVDVDFTFADMDPNGLGNGGDGINWFVDLNDASGLLASGFIPEAGGSTGVLSLANLSLNAGDRINFIVDPNGNFSFDSTALQATISEVEIVPEPSTAVLVLCGLIGLGVIRGKRSRISYKGLS